VNIAESNGSAVPVSCLLYSWSGNYAF